MAEWFINPGRKRRRKKARKATKSSARRRRRTPPRGRGGRFISRKGRKASVARRKRSRKRSSARRTTRRRSAAINPPRRRGRKGRFVTVKRRTSAGLRRVKRRSYRRNPGLINTMMRGLMDAGWVTGGKVANNVVAGYLPFQLPLPGMAGDLVKKLGIATLVSWGASRFLSGDRARLVTAGAFQSLVEGVIRQLNVPILSTALGEYDILANNYNGLGSYPRPALPAGAGFGAYPAAEFEGEQYAYDNAG